MSGKTKIWIIDQIVDGKRERALLTQERVDLARQFATSPELVNRLDTEMMTLEEDGDDSQRRDTEF
jgi:hypothetical protein